MINEATVSSMVPAANVATALRKVGVDVASFLRSERGVYRVSSEIQDPEFTTIVASLTRMQRENADNSKVRHLVDSMIINLTTSNNLTLEELNVLYSIVADGGVARTESRVPGGMKKALSKMKFKGQCKECGFSVPVYTGRYPGSCPSCGTDLKIGELESPIDFRYDYYEAYARFVSKVMDHGAQLGLNESLVCADAATACPEIQGVFEALTSAGHQTLARTLCASYTGSVSEHPPNMFGEGDFKTFRASLKELPPEILFLFRHPTAPLNPEVSEGFSSKVFEEITRMLAEDRITDERVLSVLYRASFGTSPELTSIRHEVVKRKNLMEAILSTRKSDNVFTLCKALSSCFTRAMISGEHGNGSSFRVLGEATLQMMDLAFSGDKVIPPRFLRTIFLG